MDQPTEACGPSAALLAAQAKLRSLQEQRRTERLSQGLPVTRDQYGRHLPLPTAPSTPATSNNFLPPSSLPAHLGWQSAPFTTALRLAQAPGSTATLQLPSTDDRQSPITNYQLPTAAPHPSSLILHPSIKLHPDLALAMLRGRQTAAGRLWLLLQWLDTNHCGWITIETARQHLCQKDSPSYLCGWRQLRNLITQGDGLFWQRRDGRLWLRSTVKVAAGLGVQRLTGRPIALPVETLRRGIGHARAHLYASLHSGRLKNQVTVFEPAARPISRATLRQLSQASRHTQRRYEQRTNVGRQANYAITPIHSVEEEQEQAWRRGRALFHFTDHQGHQGPPGTTYLAWRLPNSYSGSHAQQPRGRQKRMNRQLADLFTKGMTGNGRPSVTPRFYGNEQQAARAYNRVPDQDAYWPHRRQFWRPFPGRAPQ